MENCNEWTVYTPIHHGDAPPGLELDPAEWECEIKTRREDDSRYRTYHIGPTPQWLEGLTYRYRRKAAHCGGVGTCKQLHCGPVADCALRRKPPAPPTMLPEDDAKRLEYPMFDGLMAYFPNALAEVSRVSKIGNDQHNPGEPLHWARDKSTDHENKIMRHLADVGTRDRRGVRHAARLAWRSLALLQEEIERDEGLPPSRASRNRTF